MVIFHDTGVFCSLPLKYDVHKSINVRRNVPPKDAHVQHK